MKRILIYENRKQADQVWEVTTREQKALAFLELFQHLDQDWEVYDLDYWGDSAVEEQLQRKLYAEAKAGDASSAEALLCMRQSYEYENWHIEEVL